MIESVNRRCRRPLMMAAAAATVTLALAGVATPAAAERLKLSYVVYFGYLPALDVSAEVETDAQRYRIEAEVAPQSWIAWALPWTAHSSVSGRRTASGGLQPESYRSTANWGSHSRATVLEFGAADAPVHAVTEPPRAEPERESVPDDKTVGALDPVSTVLALLDSVGDGHGCPASLPVFDGRRRFDLHAEAQPNAVMAASGYSAYAGPVQVCRLRFVSLAGGYRGGERSRFWQGSGPDGQRPPIDLWLARPRDGLPVMPIHATGDSILGAITLYLSSFTVEGEE